MLSTMMKMEIMSQLDVQVSEREKEKESEIFSTIYYRIAGNIGSHNLAVWPQTTPKQRVEQYWQI